MPRQRGPGYEALPSHDEQEELADDDGAAGPSASSTVLGNGLHGSATRSRPRSRTLENALSVDVRNLDAKLKQWRSDLKKKFATKQSNNKPGFDNTKPVEILASAFAPVEKRHTISELGPALIKTLDHRSHPLTHAEFLSIVEDVKAAIRQGHHPKLNKAGSSGSYFARSTSGKTVGIFKPKDEEPYGSLNPKWTKWFHRNFLSIIFGFGRACLLPNFSYLSEAGAALLSDRLALYIVPPTELVSLSSPAFFYDYVDRRAYQRKDKPLPEKIGSFQVFMTGYKDASDFLKEHPWPGRPTRETLGLEGTPGHREKRRNWTRKCRLLCGTAGVDDDEEFDDSDDGFYQEGRANGQSTPNTSAPASFAWTQELMTDFRFELEKLVILDVLMRNTDRGLDNFMIKVCEGDCQSRDEELSKEAGSRRGSHMMQQPRAKEGLSLDGERDSKPYTNRPHVHIAAIDNSLSWPVYHPDSWRSYSYGWLYLPSSLIGLPFSKRTREHFLPILTDPKWWSQTVFELRQLFSQDTDFSERMFRKQIAVFKGQAYSVVQSLRNLDEGPLELCRRRTCIIHDDHVTVADDDLTNELMSSNTQPEQPQEFDLSQSIDFGPRRTSSGGEAGGKDLSASVDALIPPRRTMSGSKRPAYNRTSTALSSRTRPIPVSHRIDLKKNRYGGASGFALMEHMESLQRREEEDHGSEAGFSAPSEADEEDIADRGGHGERTASDSYGHPSRRAGASLDLSRGPSRGPDHDFGLRHFPRRNTMDLSASGRAATPNVPKTKVVVVERLEETNARPFFNKF